MTDLMQEQRFCRFMKKIIELGRKYKGKQMFFHKNQKYKIVT